jgi:hypothetical protein
VRAVASAQLAANPDEAGFAHQDPISKRSTSPTRLPPRSETGLLGIAGLPFEGPTLTIIRGLCQALASKWRCLDKSSMRISGVRRRRLAALCGPSTQRTEFAISTRGCSMSMSYLATAIAPTDKCSRPFCDTFLMSCHWSSCMAAASLTGSFKALRGAYNQER